MSEPSTRERWGFFLFLAGLIFTGFGFIFIVFSHAGVWIMLAGMVLAAGGFAIGVDEL